MRRRFVFGCYTRQWAFSWLLRAKELFCWPWYTEVWKAGYGKEGLSKRALILEAGVRIAELLGIGLLVMAIEVLWSGKRYRVLTQVEKAFAKTYFSEQELERCFFDEHSTVFARKYNIAFVIGFVVKNYGQPDLPLLVHELVHVRQFTRWGWAYVAKALIAQTSGAGYHYARQIAFDRVRYFSSDQLSDTEVFLAKEQLHAQKTAKAFKSFLPSLNAEQEAARLEDLALVECGFAPRWLA